MENGVLSYFLMSPGAAFITDVNCALTPGFLAIRIKWLATSFGETVAWHLAEVSEQLQDDILSSSIFCLTG